MNFEIKYVGRVVSAERKNPIGKPLPSCATRKFLEFNRKWRTFRASPITIGISSLGTSNHATPHAITGDNITFTRGGLEINSIKIALTEVIAQPQPNSGGNYELDTIASIVAASGVPTPNTWIS